MRISFYEQYKINKDNNYLTAKLQQISSANKESSRFTMKNSKSHESIRNPQLNGLSRKLKDDKIKESNFQMFKRLQEGEPVMNISKFEDEYKTHLRLKQLIKKVGPDSNKIYMENNHKDQKLPVLPSSTRKNTVRSRLYSENGFNPRQSSYTKLYVDYNINPFEKC